jgi:hypothetical protein
VQETILFSLEDKEELSLKNIKSNSKGKEEAVEGLETGKTRGQRNEILESFVYIILDQNF